jgi:hypothetical protein
MADGVTATKVQFSTKWKKTPAFRYVWYCTSPKSRGQDSVQDFRPLADVFPDFWSALRGEIQMFLMTSRQDRSRSVLARSASHLCWDWNRSQVSDLGCWDGFLWYHRMCTSSSVQHPATPATPQPGLGAEYWLAAGADLTLTNSHLPTARWDMGQSSTFYFLILSNAVININASIQIHVWYITSIQTLFFQSSISI